MVGKMIVLGQFIKIATDRPFHSRVHCPTDGLNYFRRMNYGMKHYCLVLTLLLSGIFAIG